MTTPAADNPPPPSRLRLVFLVVLVCAIAAAMMWLFGTDAGRTVRDMNHLRAVGEDARRWVGSHPVAAPLLFLAVYVICAVLAVPVWWLQILGGYGFGLAGGIVWGVAGHTAGAVAAFTLARWLGGGWVRDKMEHKLARFRRLSEAVGHNGLLVVVAARVCHVVPYNLSNYAFAVTGVRGRDVVLGTVVGSPPVVAGWVVAGARPGLVHDWRFWAIVVLVNSAVLAPLGVYAWRRRRRRP